MILLRLLGVAVVLAGCSAGPDVGRTVDGSFEVEITAPRTTFAAGEAIPVTATLTYTGTAASVRIWHALQPIGFGVEGLLNGNVRPIFAFKCASTELTRGQPLMVSFAKTGGTGTPDPSWDAFMSDPLLRLPPGVWHIYALAEFSESGCADKAREIRAELVVTVTPASATITNPSRDIR